MKRRFSLVALHDEQGRILMQDRGGMKGRSEWWGYFGGKIEEGESPKEAARREIQEELDYGVQDLALITLFQSPIEHEQWTEVEAYVFASRLSVPLEELTLLEGSGMALLSIEQIRKKKLFMFDYDILDRIEEWMRNR